MLWISFLDKSLLAMESVRQDDYNAAVQLSTPICCKLFVQSM